MIRIIGVGSPFGDDRAGLEAAARLAATPAPGVEVVLADRPGVDLIDLLCGADAAIVIDAVRSGAPAGTVYDLHLCAVPTALLAPMSSHGIGVAEALALARRLDRLPTRGRLVGIEAGATAAGPNDGLSPPVTRSIDVVVQGVRAWVDYFGSVLPDPRGGR